MLTPEQIKQHRLELGLDQPAMDSNTPANVEDRIKRLQQSTNPKPLPQKGAFQQFKEATDARGQRFQEGVTRQKEGKQNILDTTLQTVGAVAGAAGDAIGAATKGAYHLLPDAVEKAINTGASAATKAFLNTKMGQQGLTALQNGVEHYTEWSKTHPREAANLESAVNIASLFPVGEGAQTAVKAGAKQIGESAGKAAVNLEKSAVVQGAGERDNFLKALVRPIESGKRNLDEVGRTQETGSGILRKTEVTPSPKEAKAIKALHPIETIHPGNSAQQNFNAVRDVISTEAQSLEKQLSKNDFIFPKKEIHAKLRNNIDTLVKDSPVIVGDAEKVAQKLISKFLQFVDKEPNKATGLLKARKNYDAWARETMGSTKLFDPKTHNVYEVVNKTIRDTANTFLDEKATDVAVKDSLGRQSTLYDALDNIRPKAAQEADTVMGRLFDWSGKVLGEKNRAVQIMATVAGIGGLGAASTFAPAVAGLGSAGVGAWLLHRAVTSPQTKRAVAQWLKVVETNASKTGDKAILKDVQLLRGLISAHQLHAQN